MASAIPVLSFGTGSPEGACPLAGERGPRPWLGRGAAFAGSYSTPRSTKRRYSSRLIQASVAA